MLPTADTIVAELMAWCAVERGRPSRVAEIVDVNRSAVSRWLCGQRKPSLNQGFVIQEFLKHEHLIFFLAYACALTRSGSVEQSISRRVSILRRNS